MRFLLFFLSAIVLVCGFEISPAFAVEETKAANSVDAGPVTSSTILTRLPNGLLVYIIRDTRFPLVCSRLYVRAGSANEDPAQAGISHVLEHMVFKGSSHRPKGQIAREVEALGGYINAATSFDKTWYIADMPAAHWREGISVIRDMAFQATLDPEELKAEKEVVISELQRGEDSPMRKLFENLQTASLKNTPYGRPIIGYEDTIRSLTENDLRDYVRKWYQPQNMMLLVAGDIDPVGVLQYAESIFGLLKNTSDMNVKGDFDLTTAPEGAPVVEVVRGPWNKVYMGIAMPAPALRDLRSVELDVLCYLLGGDGTSLFYQKYKYDKRLVDSIDVSNMSLARAGMLSVTAQLEPDKTAEFWDELTKGIASLSAADFENSAIARAKFNLEDGMDRAGETLNGLASWQGSIQFDLGGKQGEENLRFTQRNVNQAQLQKAIDTWFNPVQARVRVLAPQNAELPDFEAIMRQNWPASREGTTAAPTLSAGAAKQTVDLGNGCTLILIPDNSAPYVSINMLFTGGNAMLKPSQQGLASLSARVLNDGCGSMSKPVLEKWLAERAASVGAHAGLQTFGINLTGPARFNEDYFGLIRDILRKPKFDPAEFKREVENQLAAIRQRNDQPLSYMFSKINPFLFPDGQPYGYDGLGTEESVSSFNVVDVRDFWTLQSGQPWALAIAGSFDAEKAIAFAKSLPAPRMDMLKIAAPEWDTKKVLELALPGRNQAHLMRIFKTVPPTHPDAPGLELLQAVLSGQSGLLFTRLRDEQGLGYTVTAFNRSMPLAGYLAFYIGTEPGKVDAAKKGFTLIEDIVKKELLPADELKAAANRLLGDYLRDRQSLAARASEAATNMILGYPEDFQRILLEKAAEVSPERLREIAASYLVSPYEALLLP